MLLQGTYMESHKSSKKILKCHTGHKTCKIKLKANIHMSKDEHKKKKSWERQGTSFQRKSKSNKYTQEFINKLM